MGSHGDYEQKVREAKALYAQLDAVPCFALGGETIRFTRIGFNHLIRKGRTPRPRTEQLRRLALIPYIKDMLASHDAILTYRKTFETVAVDRYGEVRSVGTIAEFWTLTKTIKGDTVKVVIRQLHTGGPKHFFSIMSNG